MLNLANAYKKWKKGGNSRNVNLFEKEVEKYITKQIKIKTDKIKELKEKLDEGSEEKFDNIQEEFIQIVEDSIKTTESRQSYARNYVLEVIEKMSNFEYWKEEILIETKQLEDDIIALNKTTEFLSKIDVEVEESE